MRSLFFLITLTTVTVSSFGQSVREQEFDYRMQMALDRLTQDQYHPVFTQEFILADVKLDPSNPRRFYNFSGDLSGRYIEVVSLFPEAKTLVPLPQLVDELLTYQQSDGRFGDASLKFVASEIGGEHMALLWGNGRLLVGLMHYYQQTQDGDVLEAAIRLGDFFISTYEACAKPEVRKKLEGFGAKGIICFTQYIEGLVMLTEATERTRFARAAAKTYPLLPPPGKQHSHGYLTTLRGVLKLYEYNGDQKQLQHVQRSYRALVNSNNYTLFGSVPEYFGGKGTRDEGCSTADFIRLGLHLYQLTQDTTYRNQAEHALYNALYFNQYATGDFGHHHLTKQGAAPSYRHAAWWCCTMHGLRAMREIQQKYMVYADAERLKLDLLLETEYTDEKHAFSLHHLDSEDSLYQYQIRITKWADNRPLSIRMPAWGEFFSVQINDQSIDSNIRNGYLALSSVPKMGDRINLALRFKTTLVNEKNEEVEFNGSRVAGILKHGPYLMGVDDRIDPTFNAEPHGNVVLTNSLQPTTANMQDIFISDVALTATYQHGGFPSRLQTIMIPVAEQTFTGHDFFKMKMYFATETDGTNASFDMLNPWQPNR